MGIAFKLHSIAFDKYHRVIMGSTSHMASSAQALSSTVHACYIGFIFLTDMFVLGQEVI